MVIHFKDTFFHVTSLTNPDTGSMDEIQPHCTKSHLFFSLASQTQVIAV